MYMYVVNRPRPTRYVYWSFEQSAVHFLALRSLNLYSLMYNYFTNFQPILPGEPLPLCALSARLVRLWVNPALFIVIFNILLNC